MNRPWKIWTLYFVCLAIAVPAMGWLTRKAIELERTRDASQQAAAEANRLAQHQRLVGEALWRADSLLTPLVAQEAARPHFVFDPFLATHSAAGLKMEAASLDEQVSSAKGSPAKGPMGKNSAASSAKSIEQIPSPLLTEANPWVRVYFQVTQEGEWTSPQTPSGIGYEHAISAGAEPARLAAAASALDELRVNPFHELAAHLGDDELPALSMVDVATVNSIPPALRNSNVFVANRQIDDVIAANSVNGAAQGEAFAPNVESVPQTAAPVLLDDYLVANQSPDTLGESATQSGAPPQQSAVASPLQSQATGGAFGPSATNPNASQLESLSQFAEANQPAADYGLRNQLLQNMAQSQIVQQRIANNDASVNQTLVREGIARPFWLGDKLLLARRVVRGDRELIQGCWLDWSRLKPELEREIGGVVSNARLLPMTDHEAAEPGRMLATLPVRLDAPLPDPHLARAAASVEGWNALRIGLVAAWLCLAFAATAVGALLFGVMRLSERRATFVSAVTHELRTPLTTFRLYADLLADEATARDDEARRSYVATLQTESDRLSRLVENVLQFARLERGARFRRRGLTTDWPAIDAMCRDRFQPRVAQADMSLEWKRTSEPTGERTKEPPSRLAASAFASESTSDAMSDSPRALTGSTDASIDASPAVVEQILFNLIDNACKYASAAEDRRIHLTWRESGRHIELSVRDHGPGIDPKQRTRLFRPFSRSADEAAGSAPGVGLGLALCKRLARQCGGRLRLASAAGGGAQFVARLRRARLGRKMGT